MTCSEANRLLIDLFDRTEGVETNPELSRHAATCPECSREYEEMQRALAALAPPHKVRASADFKERVINKLVAEARTAQAPEKPYRWNRFAALLPRLALAGAVVVALVVGLPYLGKRGRAPAPVLSLLAQSVEATSNLQSVHISARMRTLPNDNFDLIMLEQDFVPIEIWKQYGNPARWRIEKPGRVVVMDGASSLLLIKPNRAARGTPEAGFVYWLRPLLDVDRVLDRELSMARLRQSEATLQEESSNGTRRLVLTVRRKALGDFTNDWLRNKSIQESDHTRIYRFDAETKRLEGLQVFVHSNHGDVLVFEITEIQYNPPVDPAVFSLALPAEVVWFVGPEQMPVGARTLPLTPKEAAIAFLEGMAREDWDQVLTVYPESSLDSKLKKYVGGLQVLRIGEPFRSGLYPGWFVPYEIRFKSGELKRFNLAVRNDNPSKRYIVDGGF